MIYGLSFSDSEGTVVSHNADRLLGTYMVADDSAPIYERGLAFYKLLKIWASCRSNDLSGLNPSSLRLNSLGLCGVLERTKCTGPGKRLRHLPFFVCHSAALFVPNWLKLGWDIWDRPCLFLSARDTFRIPHDDRPT